MPHTKQRMEPLAEDDYHAETHENRIDRNEHDGTGDRRILQRRDPSDEVETQKAARNRCVQPIAAAQGNEVRSA